MFFRLPILAALVCMWLVAPGSTAEFNRWTDGGGDDLWTTVANWNSGSPYADRAINDVLIFGVTANPLPTHRPNLDASATVQALIFQDFYTLESTNGSLLTLTAPNSIFSRHRATILHDLKLAGSQPHLWVSETNSTIRFARHVELEQDLSIELRNTVNPGQFSRPGVVEFSQGSTVGGNHSITTSGGQVAFSGNNSFTGGVFVLSGTVDILTNTGFGTGALTLGSPGFQATFRVTDNPSGITFSNSIILAGGGGGGRIETNVGVSTFNRNITLGSNSLTAPLALAGRFDGTTIIAANLGRALGVPVGDTGDGLSLEGGLKMLLNGTANNYRGPTTILSGLVLVNGLLFNPAGAGDFTVDSGGTVGGTGRISDRTIVVLGILNPGGELAGNGPWTGKLTIDGALNLASGGIYRVDLRGQSAGVSYDQTAVNGAVDLSGALELGPAGVMQPGNTFTIIDNDGSDAVTGNFTGLPDNSTFPYGSHLLRVDYDGGTGNDVVLTVTEDVSMTQLFGVPFIKWAAPVSSSFENNFAWDPTYVPGDSHGVLFSESGGLAYTIRAGNPHQNIGMVAQGGHTTTLDLNGTSSAYSLDGFGDNGGFTSMIIGRNSGDDAGLVLLDGTMRTAGDVRLGTGASATGRLTVGSNATLRVESTNDGNFRMASAAGSTGLAEVTAGGFLSARRILVGELGTAVLTIRNGGIAQSLVETVIGSQGSIVPLRTLNGANGNSGQGEVHVTGSGSEFYPYLDLKVGIGGSGLLVVDDDGYVECESLTVGAAGLVALSQGGVLEVDTNAKVAVGGEIRSNDGKLSVGSSLINDGTIRLTRGGALSFGNGATFTNNGTLDLISGSFTPPPGFVNNGIIFTPADLRIRSVSRTGSTVTVTIDSLDGHTYQLQKSLSLVPASFADIGVAQDGVTGNVLTFTDAGASGLSSFYRIAVDP